MKTAENPRESKKSHHLCVFALSAVAVFLVGLHRKNPRLTFTNLGLGLLTLVLSLKSRRFIPLFGIAQCLTLAPLLGTAAASTLFAVALLASGQSSTITGTLAGQVVMEGFMHWRIKPWVRRIITRTLAVLPAVLIIGLRGDSSVTDLLTLSQVVLALQLPFAMFPLLHFTSSRRRMGQWRICRICSGS